MGILLSSLMTTLGQGNGAKLIGYKPHRFMGMAATMQRILDKWPALEAWYQERDANLVREGKVPTGFPPTGWYQHFEQLLPILTPIIPVNKRAQAEDANQVQELLSLYTVRMTALVLDQPIRRYDTTPKTPVFIQPYQLTSLVSNIHKLVRTVF
ncbi:hypothetical protein PI126_g22762 [Phytophthora idaei]|nr:hypothetical protein PI126_g22762 [Phytophthora idaei]